MLNQLRSATGSWVAKILLFLLILSFAVWGISGQILGGGSGDVVVAGKTRVTVLDYRLAYDRQIALLSQQFGTRITREQAQAFGIDQQVLAQLVAGAVLDEQAREMRLGLSRDRIAALTAEDPSFHGPDGRFDRSQFEWVLRQIGMRPEDYLRNREQVAIRQQIVEAVSDGLSTPDTFLRAMALYRGEDRTAEYLYLPRSLVEPVEAPAEADLASFFEENSATYRAPEYRRFSYVKLEPVDLADPAAIADTDARAYYDSHRVRYTTAERRTIDQIVFSSREAAEAAAERIAAGESFEEILAEQGRTVEQARLGTFEEARVGDAAIAAAAFALDDGGVSGVVDGTFGPVIVRVARIEPEAVRPFEAVVDDIRDELALDEANRIIMDVYDAYEDARASGESMAEAASARGLRMVTLDAVDRGGRRPDGSLVDDLPESSALLREVFETEAGIENPPIMLAGVGYLFYEVEEVIAARDRTLDEVRDRVVADWTDRQARQRLAERAAEAERALRDGTPIGEVAAGLGTDVQTKRGLRRQANDPDFGESGVAAVFGVVEGGTGVVTAPDGEAQIVFQVTEMFEPAGASAESVPEEERTALSSGLADDLLDQLVARLQGQYTVTIDRNAMQRALSF